MKTTFNKGYLIPLFIKNGEELEARA